MSTLPCPKATTLDLEARAAQRAYAEHVHIFAVPGLPGRYVTRSKTDPSERYALAARGGDVARSCKGFQYRGQYKHAVTLRARLAVRPCRPSVPTARASRWPPLGSSRLAPVVGAWSPAVDRPRTAPAPPKEATVVTTLITEAFEGSVTRSNEKLAAGCREGWLNVSRYADPMPPTPTNGQRVRVGLDKAGFVRTIMVLGDAHAPTTSPAATPDRDTRIVRETVLNTAVALPGRGGRSVTLAEVLTAAAQLEVWMTR